MTYKANDAPPEDNRCPTPEAVIEQFLKTTKYRKPGMFPADPFQAARYWMAHQQLADNFTEGASPPNSKGGVWSTPYHDRLIYALRRFLILKAIHQLFVIEHIELGVAWKGEPIHLYQEIVDEAAKMAKDKAKYVDDGFEKMHQALKGLTV